jgi:hypothetical protein
MKTWTRGEVIALARQGCVHCFGLGLRSGRREQQTVCQCVLRKIFQIVYAKFRAVSGRDGFRSRVAMWQPFERTGGSRRRGTFSFRSEEFLADFILLSRRALGGRATRAWRLFDWHYLRGADFHVCCRELGMHRGEFFHEVYRVQERLGRAYRDTEPYALYPLDEYFGGTTRRKPAPHPIFVLDVAKPPGRTREARGTDCHVATPLARAA